MGGFGFSRNDVSDERTVISPAKAFGKTKILYLVIQEGGSSVESYASTYDTKRQAEAAARSHRKHTYRSTKPVAFRAQIDVDGHAYLHESDMLALIEDVRDAEYI